MICVWGLGFISVMYKMYLLHNNIVANAGMLFQHYFYNQFKHSVYSNVYILPRLLISISTTIYFWFAL